MTQSNPYIDSSYGTYQGGELEHLYGDKFHVLADPFLLTLLGELCTDVCIQPRVSQLARALYEHLLRVVVNQEFAHKQNTITTRMAESSDRGQWTGQTIDASTKVVTVDIARAGMLPSQVCFETLSGLIEASNVRQDHAIMARTTDADGHVTGAHFGESKIGGDVDEAIVLLPDPMGATGSSISKAITHYKNEVEGKASKYICMNLIITPEYLKTLKEDHPDVIVYALRLDRGASSPEILATTPGTHWDQESGLTDIQYIIPGGGGFGEVLNNSYC